METKTRQKRLVPNKIDYIVLHRPKEAAQLLEEFGYKSPKSPSNIAAAVKELIRIEGREAVNALLTIHPDRHVIMNTAKEDNYCYNCGSPVKEEEDHFCSVCNHDNFMSTDDKNDLLDKVKGMAKGELERSLDSLMKKANRDPEDLKVAEETQMVWNELRSRPTDLGSSLTPSREEPRNCNVLTIKPMDGLLYLGTALLMGILIGTQFRRRTAS